MYTNLEEDFQPQKCKSLDFFPWRFLKSSQVHKTFEEKKVLKTTVTGSVSNHQLYALLKKLRTKNV